MHEERSGSEQQPPDYHSAWAASPDGAGDQVAADADAAQAQSADGGYPQPADGGQALAADGGQAERTDAYPTLSGRGEDGSEDRGSPVPGFDTPPTPYNAPPAGPEHPAVAYPGTPPPPAPGSYGPQQGGYGPGYPGSAGYPGVGYPGGGYPGAGYPGAGYPGAGYPGSSYQAGGYQGGYGAYQGNAGYGMPGGYGGPGDIIGFGQDGPPPRRGNRVITYVLVAALAAGVGAGTVLAMRHSNTSPSSFSVPGSGAIPQPGSGSGGGGSANSSTTQAVKNAVGPGIVDVISTPSYQPGGTLEGTGMVLTSNGLVLTNNHVVEGTSREVAKIANTGQEFTVTVVGTDKTDDVALLQLNGAKNLKTVPLGDSSSVQVGQSVVALGNAEGEDGAPTVVTGTITDLNRSIEASDAGAGTTENLHNMLQTNAPIVEGDSGGALASTAGRVIGMNTAANSSATGGSAGTSMGFAIPINRALSIARQIASGKATANIQIGLPAFLGVTVASSKSGPSTSTSLQTQLQQLQQAAGQSQGGFGGLGGGSGSGSTGQCMATDQPEAPTSAPNVPSGVLVGGVLCGTPVNAAGITSGAVITSIDGKAITSPAALTQALTSYRPGQTISIAWVSPSGQHHTSSVKLAPGPAK